MAVYKKTYRPYDGRLTASWSRFLVLTRYAFEELQRSRFLSLFYLATFLYPLVCALIIYVQHNLSVLGLLGVQNANRLISINVTFFLTLLGWQSMMALLMTAFVGPSLVSPDLANNALSLYLSRPFSRLEYVAGKIAVLVILLSLMTWIPGLLLFGLQGYEEGWQWIQANLRLGVGLFVGSWIWIAVLALIALALSAWVRWKTVAAGLLFGFFFVAAGFGTAINRVERTHWGHLLNVRYLVGTIWVDLFEGSQHTTGGAVFFGSPVGEEVPLWCCWMAITIVCLVCLGLLARRIRGVEVVR